MFKPNSWFNAARILLVIVGLGGLIAFAVNILPWTSCEEPPGSLGGVVVAFAAAFLFQVFCRLADED